MVAFPHDLFLTSLGKSIVVLDASLVSVFDSLIFLLDVLVRVHRLLFKFLVLFESGESLNFEKALFVFVVAIRRWDFVVIIDLLTEEYELAPVSDNIFIFVD